MTRPGLTRERWVALFLAGALAFSPPMLAIFSSDTRVFGIPLLYAYLFAAWALLVLLMARLPTPRSHRSEPAEAETTRRPRED